ncbi:hypothetical protein RHMOL_Rhmol02G0015700 [Rhododendron molle]|uniref:Uncharacterized protein n=1 Tax=Rhododendron molle TaxID=49168 RepID=A0ACC0PN25_RHOML|nr:hypothetical protein RHMOL_Rhmol02G0015700 [Rhododendron molle]
MKLMIVVGASTAYLLGSLITWRLLALTGIIPCIAILLGLFFIPESPRWLAKIGKQKEFEAALRKLRGKDADVSREEAEIQVNFYAQIEVKWDKHLRRSRLFGFSRQAYIEVLQSLPKSQMLDLVDRRYIRAVTIGVGLMIFQQFGGINAFGFYASDIFTEAGISGKAGTIAYAIIQVPITLVGAILMDKSGRRPLLMVSATGEFLGCFLTGTSFFLKGQSLLIGWDPILAVAGVLIFVVSFSIGMGAIPWVIMSEIFPMQVKGIAGSLVTLVNWLGAWAVSYTFNFLMSWSSSGTFFLYAAFSALTVLFVAKVVPETKGKTLEEIQASINT